METIKIPHTSWVLGRRVEWFANHVYLPKVGLGYLLGYILLVYPKVYPRA